MNSVAHIEDKKKDIFRDAQRLSHLGVLFLDSNEVGLIVQNGLISSIMVDVKAKQDKDPIFFELKKSLVEKAIEVFTQEGGIVHHHQGCLCIPDIDILKKIISSKPCNSRYFIHSTSTNIYRDLREVNW